MSASQKPFSKTFPPIPSEWNGHAPTPVLKKGFCFAFGFSIVELLVYLAVFATALVMIVGTALGLSRAYGGVANLSRIERDGAVVLERITREARGSERVDIGTSILGVNPSQLVFNTTDEAGAARTVEFFVSGSALRIKENSTDSGALTGSKVAVSSFVARRIATGKSEAVKIELSIQSGVGSASITKKFYATTILRNSY
ncbi:MAG: hypothetical protein Q8R17_01810 [bacterium]|nr:hypothetical protein [bacterium]